MPQSHPPHQQQSAAAFNPSGLNPFPPHHGAASTSNNSSLPDDAASSSGDPIFTPDSASRTASPLVTAQDKEKGRHAHFAAAQPAVRKGQSLDDPDAFEDWDDNEDDAAAWDDDDMPSDLRPDRSGGKSHSHLPLLGKSSYDDAEDDSPISRSVGTLSRKSTLHERDPEVEARNSTRKRYLISGGFLFISLIAFTVQTETAVYIQHNLKWNKAYCMLWVYPAPSYRRTAVDPEVTHTNTYRSYLTHGSWSVLWPVQLLILRLQNLSTPWPVFWRHHTSQLWTTAQMVRYRTLHIPSRYTSVSPIPHMFRTLAFVTCALTIAGGSWYLAVNLTTASDLTAIYNCSAFFAYAFSIPLLHEKVRLSKVLAVLVAIVGVLVVAYGDAGGSGKHGSKSGGGAGGPDAPADEEADNRLLGNLIIGVGSVLYGFYEVLYKKVLCPPDECSPTRGMIFANAVGSGIGMFTLCVLWIPLPILHFMGWETFELPHGEAAWMMLISVLANASTFFYNHLPFLLLSRYNPS